ncbi:MAG: hypothetical protein AABY15_03035 [Nanoarchaeota archaeon]
MNMTKEQIIDGDVFTIRVKHGQSEIELKIPLTKRTMVGMDSDGTGTRSLKIIDHVVDRVIKLGKEYPGKTNQTKKQ